MGRMNSKEALVAQIEEGKTVWEVLVNSLSDVQCLSPGTCGHWSVKDVIAHVSWFEQQMEWMVTRHSVEGEDTVWWNLSTDERNAKIFALYKDLPLDDVKKMAQERYDKMLAAMRNLEDADVTDPSRYEGMPSDWKPSDIIGQNTWLHYADHLEAIQQKFGK